MARDVVSVIRLDIQDVSPLLIIQEEPRKSSCVVWEDGALSLKV